MKKKRDGKRLELVEREKQNKVKKSYLRTALAVSSNERSQLPGDSGLIPGINSNVQSMCSTLFFCTEIKLSSEVKGHILHFTQLQSKKKLQYFDMEDINLLNRKIRKVHRILGEIEEDIGKDTKEYRAYHRKLNDYHSRIKDLEDDSSKTDDVTFSSSQGDISASSTVEKSVDTSSIKKEKSTKKKKSSKKSKKESNDNGDGESEKKTKKKKKKKTDEKDKKSKKKNKE